MKKVNLLKVGLTTIAMMVLSACGGGGGGDTPTTASTNTTTGTNATTGNQQTGNQQAGNQQAGNQQTGNQQPGNQGSGTADNGLANELKNLAALITDTNKKLANSETDKQKLLDKIAELETKLKTPASDPEKEKLNEALKETKKQLEGLNSQFTELTEKLAQAEREEQEKKQKQQEENNNKQNAANNSPWVAETPVNIGKSHVGYLHTKKNQSDLDVLGNGSVEHNDAANTALLMTNAPDPALDTLVFAHYKDKHYYLEDLNLRQVSGEFDGLNNKYVIEYNPNGDTGSNNKVVLAKAYINSSLNPLVGREARANDPMQGITQVADQGANEDVEALIYRENQKIYIPDEDFKANPYDPSNPLKAVRLTGSGYPVSVTGGVVDVEDADLIDRSGTIFELYGAKTTDYFNNSNDKKKNLPLEDKALKYVQYGRATSQMSGQDLGVFIEGLRENTFIVPYGAYGDTETENHYFARGTNNTTAEQVLDLSKYYGTNELVYNGHAVTYGVDHDYRDGNVREKGVPTALSLRDGVTPLLVSGSHIRANVNLDTKLVKGDVYNTWALFPIDPNKAPTGKLKQVETPLVSFEGNLAANGNIAGAAKNLTKNEAPGLFNATLYGPKAEEMGGVIVSENPEKLTWGVSFGAINKTEKPAVSDTFPGTIHKPGVSVVSEGDGANVSSTQPK